MKNLWGAEFLNLSVVLIDWNYEQAVSAPLL
jgi:hypothetical protein